MPVTEHFRTPVTDALNSTGQALDASVRALMEATFRSDFSHVRVHTDATASQSALIHNAHAYTVGTDIVFGAGEYEPHTADGRKLLAHELSHVVQQSDRGHVNTTASPATAEREARRLSDTIDANGAARVSTRAPVGAIQRQENKNPKDDTAKAIIARAKDSKTPAADRAVHLIKDIVTAYYPGDAAKLDAVVYDNAAAGTGLQTESVGSGSNAKGKVSVGDTFLNSVDNFARRVLQVGHELQHIEQYRTGLAGGQHKNLREFLAFHDEALAAEKSGTGRMSYATRRDLIDGALGYFHCLTADEQKENTTKKDALMKRRAEVDGKAGNDPTSPPTSCKK
ncbi:DUF4157 domain-containing protein [Mycobacterium sp. 852013-50091_SCH5140682]|uniref:eCIS core domain-containing protein n=1 Tax=Mycobacterium sp. 852013-50091_SCH5140682 TaxID=1834109 RepID=UPI0018D3729E|nr:DUF4157 domain-containing protein [Mycobacterium sp. 852013-50091_SCH5140682]